MAMSVLTLGMAAWAIGLATVGFLFICLLLVLIVLIQRPQGGGLSAAFGAGGGSGQTAFGAKTGDALTIATVGIFVLFLIGAVGLNFAIRPDEDRPAAVATEEGASESAGGAGAPSETPPTGETPAPAASDDAAGEAPTEVPATVAPEEPAPEGGAPAEEPVPAGEGGGR